MYNTWHTFLKLERKNSEVHVEPRLTNIMYLWLFRDHGDFEHEFEPLLKIEIGKQILACH